MGSTIFSLPKDFWINHLQLKWGLLAEFGWLRVTQIIPPLLLLMGPVVFTTSMEPPLLTIRMVPLS